MNDDRLAIVPLADLTATELQHLQSRPLTGPFFLPELLALWRDCFRWQGIGLRCGRILLVGFIKRSLLGRHFYSMPFGMYGGLYGEANPAPIADWITSQRFAEVRIIQPDSASNHFGALVARELRAHLVDLTASLDYSDNTARNLRKAASSGFDVRLLDSSAKIPALAMLARHEKRTGELRRLPVAAYDHLLANLRSEPPGIIAGGLYQGEQLVALQIFFVSRLDAFYFDGFALPEALQSGGNFYLLDSMISHFRAAGLQHLNLGASPPGDAGLLRFKSGFGAAEFVYREYSAVSGLKHFADRLRGRA